MGELNHADAAELLGVYALDALADDERAAVEAVKRLAAELAQGVRAIGAGA